MIVAAIKSKVQAKHANAPTIASDDVAAEALQTIHQCINIYILREYRLPISSSVAHFALEGSV